MFLNSIKKLFSSKFKRTVKDHLGVPSLHWSLQNLKRKNFTPKFIIDIGAYKGLWTLDVLEVFPKAKILMVEAQENKEPFLQAIKAANKNVDYSISLLSSDDTAVRSFAEHETASHIVATEAQGVVYKKIQTQSLDTLLADRQLPYPDFLKLDVQGHEMEVLKGAEKSLANCSLCLLEITILNIGDDTPLLCDMIAFMDARGFQAYDISQFIRLRFDKALYQIDMFFIRKDSFLISDKAW